jgi:hypothetical protein
MPQIAGRRRSKEVRSGSTESRSSSVPNLRPLSTTSLSDTGSERTISASSRNHLSRPGRSEQFEHLRRYIGGVPKRVAGSAWDENGGTWIASDDLTIDMGTDMPASDIDRAVLMRVAMQRAREGTGL